MFHIWYSFVANHSYSFRAQFVRFVIQFQARITSEQNHIYRMHLLSKLDADTKANNNSNRSDERTAYSDNVVHKSTTLPWSRYDGAAAHAIIHDNDDTEEDVVNGGATDDVDEDDDIDTFDPRKAYKYFSNSARLLNASVAAGSVHAAISPPRKSFQAFMEVKRTSPSDTLSTVSDYCKRCLSQMRNALATTTTTAINTKSMCVYCDRRRHNLPINEEFCLKCSVRLATATERQSGMCTACRRTDLRCGFCQKHIDVCPTCGAVFCLRCHRRHQLRQVDVEEASRSTAMLVGRRVHDENEENVRPIRHRELTPSPVREPQRRSRRVSNNYDEDRPIITHARNFADAINNTNNSTIRKTPRSHHHHAIRPAAEDSDSEHDLPEIGFVRNDNNGDKPFSTNLPRTSIFHPESRVDVPKLALNIHHGLVYVDEQASKYTTNYDAFPVPLMPTANSSNNTTNNKGQLGPVAVSSIKRSSPTPPKRNTQPSQAVRMLQEKWEVSVNDAVRFGSVILM